MCIPPLRDSHTCRQACALTGFGYGLRPSLRMTQGSCASLTARALRLRADAHRVTPACGGKRNVRDTDDLENITVGAFCERPPHLLPARVILSGAKRSRNLSEQIASEDQTTDNVVWNLGREGTISCEIRAFASKRSPLRASTTDSVLRSE